MDMIEVVLLAASVPSAVCSGIVGLLFWKLKRRIDQNEAAQRQRDAARLDYEVFQIKMASATAALGKANAIAIKNGRCNGETTSALEWLEEVKHDQRSFLVAHGIEHIYEKL